MGLSRIITPSWTTENSEWGHLDFGLKISATMGRDREGPAETRVPMTLQGSDGMQCS